MFPLIEFTLTTIAILICIPVAMFCVEVLLALAPPPRPNTTALPNDHSLAVLIPAHDEAAVIGATLRTLLPTIPPGGRVLVVADNCTDATAAIAREMGAEVAERQNS